MSKDVRRVHPRVSYEQRIRLLGEDGKPAIVGRTMNLSPSGIYVRAPNGCEIGSEVTCDLPLPGGTRQLRGRVTRTEPFPDESTGIGIQFVDLSTGDSTSLHRVLEGNGPRPVAVKVVFEGMAKPIRCNGVVTAEGIRLSTSLPFLRLGSDVQAVYDGRDSKIDARGVLTGVRLEPVGGDGVPRLGVDVDLDSEVPLESSARTSELSRDDASVGGAFSTWDRPPATARAEPPVVTELQDDPREVTAVVPSRPLWRAVASRFAALSAGGFVVVALATFAIVYVVISRVVPRAEANLPAELAAPGASAAGRLQPLVVPSSAPVETKEEGAPSAPAPPATAADRAPALAAAGPVAIKDRVAPAGASAATAVAGASGATRLGARPRVRPRVVPAPAPGSPFQFDEASGRYELRPGASIDMKGEPIIGLGGIVASDGAAGNNMRGINVAVESGALYQEIALPRAETDGHFGVQVAPSWPTTFAIVGKSTAGFTVSFGTPAPANAHLDWLLVR